MQVTHTYDVHPRLTAVTGSIAERGPLAASNEIVVAGAVDRGSQGPSARSHLSRAVGAATDYDRMTRRAQINTRWAKTGLATEAVDGVLSHPAHLGVAAKSGTPLYRGVTEGHHAYDDALQGTAMPGNLLGHRDGVLHSAGMTENSMLTSWTTDRSVAQRFATNGASGRGVILETTLEQQAHRTVQGLDLGESEVLLQGIVTGCRVTGCG